MNRQVLRIIDANLNRAGEGLRVLEEVSRLLLDDAAASQQLKDLRHELLRVDPQYYALIVAARDASGDVGADMAAAGDDYQRGLPAIVTANARRVQESLRVLEELARLPEINLETDRFRKARFRLYTLEKELLAGLEARK